MALEPSQDYDKNGKMSNSYTREVARQSLSDAKDLTPGEKQTLENQTQVMRGDELRKANVDRLKEKK